MTKKIEKLTRKQKEYLPIFRENWLQIGLDTTPVDFNKAENCISDLYKWRGLKVPEFLHFSSPMLCELFINLICSDKQLESQLESQFESQFESQLWSQLWSQLKSQLWSQLGSQLESQLRSQLESKKLNYMGTWFNGQQDSYWVAWLLFGKEIGVQYDEHSSTGLNIWSNIAKECHWFYPFNDFCLISDKPKELHRDWLGRLHNENDAAISYSDNWSLYFVHGISVPEWIIKNPEKITPEKIQLEKNAEVRRIMMKIYGWEKMFKDVNAKLIDKHFDNTIGELWGWKESDGIDVRVIRVQNGTKNPFTGQYDWYTLRVPLTVGNNVIDAVRWTYPSCRNMSREDYLIQNASRS